VRDDVISDLGCLDPASLSAEDTQRVFPKELPRRLAPFVPISHSRGIGAVAPLFPPLLALMLGAAPFVGEGRTTRMIAGVRRSIGHQEYFLLRTISLTSAEVLPSSAAFLPGNEVWSDSPALRWQSLHVQCTQDGPLRSLPSSRPSPSLMQSNSGRMS
jgi:hypothetical protein